MSRIAHTFVSQGIFCPLITPKQAGSAALIVGLRAGTRNWIKGNSHRSKIDAIVDAYRDYDGRFYDPVAGFIDPMTNQFQEAFIDMEPLEDAPIEWWRDHFGPNPAPIRRVRAEAVPRWQAIGSLYRAYHPAEFMRMMPHAANHNRPPRG